MKWSSGWQSTRGPRFNSCYLQTFFKRTCRSQICSVSVHSDKNEGKSNLGSFKRLWFCDYNNHPQTPKQMSPSQRLCTIGIILITGVFFFFFPVFTLIEINRNYVSIHYIWRKWDSNWGPLKSIPTGGTRMTFSTLKDVGSSHFLKWATKSL